MLLWWAQKTSFKSFKNLTDNIILYYILTVFKRSCTTNVPPLSPGDCSSVSTVGRSEVTVRLLLETMKRSDSTSCSSLNTEGLLMHTGSELLARRPGWSLMETDVLLRPPELLLWGAMMARMKAEVLKSEETLKGLHPTVCMKWKRREIH